LPKYPRNTSHTSQQAWLPRPVYFGGGMLRYCFAKLDVMHAFFY
jgi:hypothetical protein